MSYFFASIESYVLNLRNFLVQTREFARLSLDMVSLQEETTTLNVAIDKDVKVFISA